MNAQDLYRAGRLDAAVDALSERLREDPTDSRSRTFLFELLCFTGDLDRAGRQLEVLARDSDEADIGAWMYRSALHAEQTRREMFETGAFPSAEPPGAPSGSLDGEAFGSIEDADPRIGSRLEVFAAGQYTWIPFRHISSVHMETPKRLRDLYWTPARVTGGPEIRDLELGEVLLPAVTAMAWAHEDGDVRLGRTTDVVEQDDGTAVPVGPKILMIDGEPVPLLEVRELIIDAPTS